MNLLHNQKWFSSVLVVFIIMAAGIGIKLSLLATLGLVSLAFIIIIGLLIAPKLPHLFLLILALLLMGYAFLGKGFANLGVPPLYVGELTLGVGIFAAIVGGKPLYALRSYLSWLIIAFILWGLVCTIPYLNIYGINALRDGVIWGYAIFALLVSSFLFRSKLVPIALKYYGYLLPVLLVWIPIAALINSSSFKLSLLTFKAGDMAVHLAGAASFLILGLHYEFLNANSKPLIKLKEWIWWAAWLISFLIVSALNRGGFLSIIVAVLTLLMLRPAASAQKWIKPIIVCFMIMVMFVGFDIKLDLGSSRQVSPQQIITNIQSISGNSSRNGNLEDTKDWRLNWWTDIIDDTFFGKYFWTGQGFGVNLATEYDVPAPDQSLRSPHNGHLTVLARAGVPGLALWIVLQIGFALSLISAYLQARRARKYHWAKLDLWILAYWLAFIVNMTFDVYLEGPQGGIWFWSLFGFGIAVMEMQHLDLHSAG